MVSTSSAEHDRDIIVVPQNEIKKILCSYVVSIYSYR